MYVHPDVVVAGDARLARVQPHPDSHGHSARPRARSKFPLGGDGRAHRIARAREHDEERVALGAELLPADAAATAPRTIR